jgi:hypothetical protein
MVTSEETGWRCEQMSSVANHFGHRESDGIVVDLFWHPGNLEAEFRVEVEDQREGARFVLHPPTGRDAIQAFHHPFWAARAAVNGEARAAKSRSWDVSCRTGWPIR